MNAQAFTTIVTALAQGASAWQQYQAGRLNDRLQRFNARLAEMQANDEKRRGEEEAAKQRRAAARLASRQRAALAASGVDPSSGTPAELQAETQFISKIDEATIRANARRAAWGYRVQAGDFRLRGGLARAEGENAAASTLLGAAAGVYDRWPRG